MAIRHRSHGTPEYPSELLRQILDKLGETGADPRTVVLAPVGFFFDSLYHVSGRAKVIILLQKKQSYHHV